MLSPDQWVLDDKDGLVPLDKWQKTVDVMARVFKAPAGFIVQFNPIGYQVVIASNQETNPYPAGVEIAPDTNIFCKKVVHEQTPLYVKDASQERAWDTNPEVADDGFKSYLGLPVAWPNGAPFGTICVMDYAETDYKDDYLDLISELRDLIEADLSILSQYQMMSNLALTDELTGLYNRRGFFTVGRQYMALAKRSGLGLGLLYLDLDGLKAINDNQGHQSGDEALQTLAEVLERVVRDNDVPARMSGDEFVVLVAVESNQQLDQIADRISAEVAKCGLSVSIGRVLISAEQALEHWLEEADQKMYEEKQTTDSRS